MPYVLAAQAGDAASFDVLYRRHLRTVHAVLLGRAMREEAEDLVQDTFLAAWDRIGSLRDPAAFAGWVLSIARHLHVDHVRRARPTHPLDDPRFGRPATEGGDGPMAGRRAAHLAAPADAHQRVEAQRVLDAIRGLREAYRETLLLRLVEGLTGPEIALRTGLTPESVRVNLCRGMKLLREALDPQRPTSPVEPR